MRTATLCRPASRLACLLLGGLAVTGLAGSRSMPPLQDMIVRTGEVSEVAASALVISDEDGRRYEFSVPASTPISLDGRSADLWDLKSGYSARVATRPTDESAVAEIIEVSTRK